jgi:hypothetical protein
MTRQSLLSARTEHPMQSSLRTTSRIAAVAALAASCSTPPRTAPQPAQQPTAQAAIRAVARPVAGTLDVRWLVPATDTMVISREADAAPVVYRRPVGGSAFASDGRNRIEIGMTIQRVRRVVDPAGHEAFEVAFEQRDSSAVLVQTTTWVDAHSLQPLHQLALLDGDRVVTLAFGRGQLVVIDSAPGRPPRTSAAPVPDSAYTSAAVDLVLRALPLSMGYHATVPVYFPADQQVFPLDVRVEGADRVTMRNGHTVECWVVAADFPGNVTERFWIDQRSHAMIRILAHDGIAALVRYDR